MVGDIKWYTDMRKHPDICPGLHSKFPVQQQGSVKCSITVNTLKIWHFQRSDMQVRCSTQPFADCCFANQALQGQKQVRKTSEARGSLDDCLWNPSVGNRLCASFSFSMMFSFQVWVHCLPLPLLKIFLLWTLRSCFTGKQSHGSTSKKKHL